MRSGPDMLAGSCYSEGPYVLQRLNSFELSCSPTLLEPQPQLLNTCVTGGDWKESSIQVHRSPAHKQLSPEHATNSDQANQVAVANT
jgi:hypothetical protein